MFTTLASGLLSASTLVAVADHDGEKTVRFFILLLTVIQMLMGLPASP